ncbi:uncharacterized protein LOC101455088 [Ceratitis capitata]|uniref:uncharacterized protein LOC101455088 n=1 Tax=Ceratitis capitata TaxID=7213 RepID=UPI00061885E0|nr:uncharacterized protein LOC101455088 [Ceratitis capitata]
MSPKLICLLLLLTLCAAVFMVEARGGRGRGGSLGSAFYRRSHKKHSSSGGSGSRRKVVSGSPVHTTYTKSLMTGQGVDEKFVRHRSRTRLKSHKSHTNHGSTSGHKSHTHVETPHNSHNSHTISGKKAQHDTHSAWNPFGGSVAHHNTPLGNSHISQNWGGHQLPAGHVHVTQPSSMPVNAVYYAQPPRQSSSDDNSLDFALGYLVGRSLTRTHYHHHHNYQQEAQQQQAMNNDQPLSTTTATPTSSDQSKSSDQTHYWPTDTEVSLAPLNNTLIPNGVTEKSAEVIFKNPPVLSAQSLTRDNLTFELPGVTAPPPVTPPTGGIICMPWTFNETDPANPENVIVVQKTICFPAPPPPPPPPSTPLAPIAGDIQMDASMATTTTTTASISTTRTAASN